MVVVFVVSDFLLLFLLFVVDFVVEMGSAGWCFVCWRRANFMVVVSG